MHICRLIRIRRKGAVKKQKKAAAFFRTLPNVGILKASQIPQSDLLGCKQGQAKKLDDFLRRLKCVLKSSENHCDMPL